MLAPYQNATLNVMASLSALLGNGRRGTNSLYITFFGELHVRNSKLCATDAIFMAAMTDLDYAFDLLAPYRLIAITCSLFEWFEVRSVIKSDSSVAASSTFKIRFFFGLF